MANNANASTPVPGTGGNLNSAAGSIEGLLSDDFTIGGTQEAGETRREPREGKGKPKPRAQDHEAEDPERHDAGEHPSDDDPDPDEDGEHGEEGHDELDDEGDESEELEESDEGQDDPKKVTDDTEVTVEIDGKAEKVSLGELKKGYLRQADYTRKTQAVAKERETVQREQAETRAERDQLKQGIEQVAFLYQQMTPKEPTQAEWDALHAQDPQEWMRQREYWRTWKEQQAAIAAAYQDVHQRQRADFEKQLKDRLAVEKQKLLEAIPEWKDGKTAKAEGAAIREYAYSLGYSPQDVDTTIDHRIFIMARKAMKYDELMERRKSLRPGAAPTKTKIVRPGTQGTKPTNRTAIDEARKRLVKERSVGAAASLIEKLL